MTHGVLPHLGDNKVCAREHVLLLLLECRLTKTKLQIRKEYVTLMERVSDENNRNAEVRGRGGWLRFCYQEKGK